LIFDVSIKTYSISVILGHSFQTNAIIGLASRSLSIDLERGVDGRSNIGLFVRR